MKLTIGTINWLHPKSVFLMGSLAALLSVFDVFELPPLLSVFFPRSSLSDGNWYLFWTSLTHGHDHAVKSLPYPPPPPCLSDALADQWRFSGKLPTYPSPEPSFCPKWGVIVNVSLGGGGGGGQFNRKLTLSALAIAHARYFKILTWLRGFRVTRKEFLKKQNQ